MDYGDLDGNKHNVSCSNYSTHIPILIPNEITFPYDTLSDIGHNAGA